MNTLIADEVLVWVHVPEFETGAEMAWDDAVKLARERDQAAAEQLKDDALKLENVERAAAICNEALETVPEPVPAWQQKIDRIMAELGY